MTTVRDGEIEAMDATIAVLETEITSYIDQLAEAIQDRDRYKRERDAAVAQLAHAKATGVAI